MKGAAANPEPPTLHCIEISQTRYDALVQRYRGHAFVRCYHASSVPIEAFPTAAEVEHFYETVDSNLREVPLTLVLDWLQEGH